MKQGGCKSITGGHRVYGFIILLLFISIPFIKGFYKRKKGDDDNAEKAGKENENRSDSG